MQLFDHQPLVTCLDVADLVLLHKLVNGAINSSVLLAKINFRILGLTRLIYQFVHTFSRTKCLKFGPLVRVQIEWKTLWVLRWTSFSISWISRPIPCLTSHPTNQCAPPFLPFSHLAPISQSFHFLIIYNFICTFFFYGSNYCY